MLSLHTVGEMPALVDARFAAYLVLMTVLIVNPGPDTSLVVRNALRGGRRMASLSTLGIAIGSATWALASVLGVALLLQRSAFAFDVFKWGGAAYLVYLGLRSILGGSHVTEPQARATATGDAAALRQGLFSNLLNPKAGAIFATAMPQFLVPGDSPMRFVLMILGYELVLVAWLHVYVFAIGGPGRKLGRRLRLAMERVSGVVLVGLGARLALERR